MLEFDNLAGTSFDTSLEADSICENIRGQLGLTTRYPMAKLAIVRSLSEKVEGLEAEYAKTDRCKEIRGSQLFGMEARSRGAWLSLITQHHERDVDLPQLRKLIFWHWHRGAHLLQQDWEKSGEKFPDFISSLVRREHRTDPTASKPPTPGENEWSSISSSETLTVSIGEIVNRAGSKDAASAETMSWEINGQGGSPHSAIMGGVGSGKTRTAVDILKQVRKQIPQLPIIVFDFKGDLDQGHYKLSEDLGATVLDMSKETIVPLNVFELSSHDSRSIHTAALNFRDSFSKLKGSNMGAIQKNVFYEATVRALEENTPCSLEAIRDTLEEEYEEHDIKEDGVIATIREICRIPLFQPDNDAQEFFRKNWVIQLLPSIPDNSSRIVVNLVLDALDRYLNGLPDSKTTESGARNLRILCMIDEAHKIFKTKQQALSNLIRMSRAKGGCVMLISQSPDDFSKQDDDFLNEMGLVAAFGTNASAPNVKRILGPQSDLSTLSVGQCYVKKRGDAQSKKVQAWSKGS